MAGMALTQSARKLVENSHISWKTTYKLVQLICQMLLMLCFDILY